MGIYSVVLRMNRTMEETISLEEGVQLCGRIQSVLVTINNVKEVSNDSMKQQLKAAFYISFTVVFNSFFVVTENHNVSFN